ncbi:MAG: hypothetical protein WAY25_08645, partial [Trichococcus flocculiformis]
IEIRLDAETFYLSDFSYRSIVTQADQKAVSTTELTGEFDLYDQAKKLKSTPVFDSASSVPETSDSSF